MLLGHQALVFGLKALKKGFAHVLFLITSVTGLVDSANKITYPKKIPLISPPTGN